MSNNQLSAPTTTTADGPDFKDQTRPAGTLAKAEAVAVDEEAQAPVSAIPIYSLRRAGETSTLMNSNPSDAGPGLRYLVKLALVVLALVVVVLAVALGVTLSRGNTASTATAPMVTSPTISAPSVTPVATEEPAPTSPPSQQPTLAPSLATWTGSYTGEARFGATNGTWGNGGAYRMVIDRFGQVTINGQLLLGVEYDASLSRLEWTIAAGNDTEGNVTFRQTFTSEYYFADKNDFRVGQSFTGAIRPAGPSGFLDYRGILE